LHRADTWRDELAATKPRKPIAADGDSVYKFEGTGADGSALAYGFTVKYAGNDVPVTGSGMPYGADHVAIKRVDSHTYSAILKKDGNINWDKPERGIARWKDNHTHWKRHRRKR
jgi:hypothetical protein